MRLIRSILAPLAVVALSAAVRPAIAQQAATAEKVRPVVNSAHANADTVRLRTLAVYRFSNASVTGMPSQVTVADSSGELVASFRRAGTANATPMLVDVLDNDITLHGATPSGVLTLVLFGQNDPTAAGALIGRIGTSPDDTFFIGTERLPFRVRTSGRLYLGINDDTLDDDTGAFQVAVTR